MSKHVQKVRQAVEAATTQGAESIRKLWLDAALALSKADRIGATATAERKGGYTLAVSAAITAGNGDAFERVTNQVFAEIRANRDGLAKKLGCKLGKGRKGSPPGYLIPSGIMSAKSVLGSAFQYGVALTVAEDGETRPRTFTAIRQDVTEQREAERVATLEGRERSVYMVRVMAGKVADAADAFTNDELPDVLERLTALVKIAQGAMERGETETESKGAELAEGDESPAEAAA